MFYYLWPVCGLQSDKLTLMYSLGIAPEFMIFELTFRKVNSQILNYAQGKGNSRELDVPCNEEILTRETGKFDNKLNGGFCQCKKNCRFEI